jgi:hypothetical protein
MGINETLEVLDFSIQVLKDLKAAKQDDGSISVVEIVSMALANASAAVKAAMGADEIVAEMGDLKAEEVKMIAEKGIELAKAAMALLSKA